MIEEMDHKKNISQAEFERIEKYLLNQMNAEDKLDFEKELSEDSDLQEKLEEIKTLTEGIEKLELMESLNQFHREMKEEENTAPQKIIRFNWKPFSVAASVILIAAISILYYNRPDRNERLFTKYYTTDPGLVTAMSANEDNYEFERGMVDFKSGKFQLAIDRWEPLLANNPTGDTLNYFLGTSYLELQNTAKAISRLEKVTENPESKFLNDAWWYLALAYTRDGDKDKAIMALRKTNHSAKNELLNQLEKK